MIEAEAKKNAKRRAAMAEIQRRGLNLIQHGKAWRICGLNVDVIVSDLADLDHDHLLPHLPRKGWALYRDEAPM